MSLTVKAVVTVKEFDGGLLSNISLTSPLDGLTDLLGRTFLLELVSTEFDSKTNSEKERITGYAGKVSEKENVLKYEGKFNIPKDFGEVGAILVQNESHKEIYVNDITLQGFPSNVVVNFACESWVHSKFDNSDKRIFFSNKSYMPSETPNGLKKLRQKELENLRGNGKGERKHSDRIYDYDTYNDLGDPDSDINLLRPVLGGKKHPYPRRCRTGRKPAKTDPQSESRSTDVYVPRDDKFSDIKKDSFTEKTLKNVLHSLIPQLSARIVDQTLGFPHFTAIDSLFRQGILLPKGANVGPIPTLVKTIADSKQQILLFPTPEMFERDKFSWFRDEEFARQTLAGLNPFSIELVKEWPIKSKLDPAVYGSAESLITNEVIEYEICGAMTAEEAFKKKRLFMLDYHDFLMPYVGKIRELEGTTLYGSRTLFFLTNEGTLKPLAIELTRPPIGDKPLWRHVFTPSFDATKTWLWRMAKAHVCAHDSGYHQLVIHWLRTHCVTEPYIVAANRQLSAMHPIYRLLLPHFRYTLEINALARESLINAGGTIENGFSPAKYSMELSSVAYDKLWRFDMEGLPADLIHRGMAVEDSTAPHGLKLAIEDYPFANDALIMWDSIKQWVSDYVNRFYKEPIQVETDTELQAWWTEVRTKGHQDKKDEPWWPVLKSQNDLIETLTTIIWVSSGHHAAVNFGQYLYGGYFPNRPSIARINMPTEEPIVEEDYNQFINKPEITLLRGFPTQVQATQVMAVLDVLSTHSPDEEYIGQNPEPYWEEDAVIKAAFVKFNAKMKDLEGIIDARNGDKNLRNRNGAGVVPYQLMKPFSKEGTTGRGVPNSISI
ncbi:linoleate 13S-lipoxygenase 2-1, chloroplastic-like [Mercurialis annua]|uniref:linoleate 13S-lipoxygenase 2-1, chloroplastic-like n=1 Tax=Mercurialis annua TaxID=3986 RepID=UPI002160948A|nr:linoleate 13S-lipoxygenase 2-1, chloroplastic-like [Mercurialis annua]